MKLKKPQFLLRFFYAKGYWRKSEKEWIIRTGIFIPIALRPPNTVVDEYPADYQRKPRDFEKNRKYIWLIFGLKNVKVDRHDAIKLYVLIIKDTFFSTLTV